MTTITTHYMGREITIEEETEKSALKAMAKRKREVAKLAEIEQRSLDTAYTRAREAICHIAERISHYYDKPENERRMNWSYRTVNAIEHKPWVGSLFEFCLPHCSAKRHFYIGESTINELTVLSSAQGDVAVYDPASERWYGIGAHNAMVPGVSTQMAMVEIPRLIADHFGVFSRS